MPKQAVSITKTLAALADLSNDTTGPRSAPLKIHFHSSTTSPTIVTHPGARLPKEAAAPNPLYSVSTSALSHLTIPNADLSPWTSADSHSSDGRINLPLSDPDQLVPKYLVVTLDLDAPFPSFPILGPILHGIQADLTLATENLDPDDEFIPLEPAEEDWSTGSAVVDYMGPAPPGPSAPHRYVFMLWEQPGELTTARICEEMGLPEDGDDVSMFSRVRWDQEGFERKLGLERVVAGNYFVC
ncbi:phosphatidylethanolamine-binding protein [Apodospora peruviana]|uniref:Phosphatidylethanolamine-binding protein n=1 Tax=Apodospora peruviana TaxID=516989 RepID=A0AAE0M456_9PEZI|nr:phosphatidylethanolamine-binding protein [Apodospora peruviana]